VCNELTQPLHLCGECLTTKICELVVPSLRLILHLRWTIDRLTNERLILGTLNRRVQRPGAHFYHATTQLFDTLLHCIAVPLPFLKCEKEVKKTARKRENAPNIRHDHGTLSKVDLSRIDLSYFDMILDGRERLESMSDLCTNGPDPKVGAARSLMSCRAVGST
jgi:hypothetical protein